MPAALVQGSVVEGVLALLRTWQVCVQITAMSFYDLCKIGQGKEPLWDSSSGKCRHYCVISKVWFMGLNRSMKVLRTMTDITTKMSLMWELILEEDRSPAILMGCVRMDFPKEKMEMSNRTTYSTIDTVQQAYLFWKRHTCLLAGPWVGKIVPRTQLGEAEAGCRAASRFSVRMHECPTPG